MHRRLRHIALTASIICIALVGLIWITLRLPSGANVETVVLIPRNASVVASIDSVDAHCSLPTPWLVALVARSLARVQGETVQAGWYRFAPHERQWDILVGLFSGSKRPTQRVTIPEGLTYREIAGLLARSVEADSADFVRWCEDTLIVRRYAPREALSMEGLLMPDTYDIYWKSSSDEIGERLVREWRKRHADSIPTYRDLILASIVQAEAGTEQEMPRIAGVYQNRLRRGMPLAADPTVQYGLGNRRKLYYRDLKQDTPWNTYVHPGLPPSPINNPGVAAISAARHPEKHRYLYFVARGDSSGLHRFAVNGSDHIQNVQAYRRARKQR